MRVACSSCGLVEEFEYRDYYQPVDYYAKFLDAYERGAQSPVEGTVVNKVQ